jgi:histidinol-phosphate aminotransferase
MITTAVAAPGAAVLAPDPSFEMYRIDAQLANLRFVPVALREDFALDLDAMEAAMAREARPWSGSPVRTTRRAISRRSRCRTDPARGAGLVVVDEATMHSPSARSSRACWVPEPRRRAHGFEDRHGRHRLAMPPDTGVDR